MEADKTLLNGVAIKSKYLHQLTLEESFRMKTMLLMMLKDFRCLCQHNGITYMLGGGSALGAVRHKGFIPWDDDLDVMMFRKDYEKLIDVLRSGKMGAKYEFNNPSKEEDCKNTFLKIYRKDTLDDELINENAPFPKGIFLDVFPMDSAPKSKLLQYIKGMISDLLHTISTCVLYAQYPSKRYKEFSYTSKSTKRRYQIRMLIGNLCKIIPHSKWVWWFDQFNSSTKPTGFTTIPTGRKRYVGEILPTEIFLPVREIEFEGEKVWVPGQVEKYLTSLYGDYMKLPSEDKRERHFVYKFKCELPE